MYSLSWHSKTKNYIHSANSFVVIPIYYIGPTDIFPNRPLIRYISVYRYTTSSKCFSCSIGNNETCLGYIQYHTTITDNHLLLVLR